MTPHLPPRRATSGFALVEALITVMVLTIALGVALTGFDNLSDTSDGAGLMADTNLNLRSALNVITRDLLSAGRDIPVGGIAVPSGDGAVPLVRPSAGGTALTFEAGATTLDSVTPGNALGPDIEGTPTDIITILMADTSLAHPVAPPPVGSRSRPDKGTCERHLHISALSPAAPEVGWWQAPAASGHPPALSPGVRSLH